MGLNGWRIEDVALTLRGSLPHRRSDQAAAFVAAWTLVAVERIERQCAALAADIRQSREQILEAWRSCVDQDPELTTASSITRSQFRDSIPKVLDAFEMALRADDALRETQANLEQREGASEHGLHRWQQGYDLRETMREWAHLHRCLLAHLERYAAAHPELEPGVMQRAREALVRLCGEGACESAARYARLQQADAASRMRDLEFAVQQLQVLEKNRIEMLREAAHDLRGSVSVISNASAVLVRSQSEDMRSGFYTVLERGIRATQSLLNDLIDFTRLEAGQDRLQISSFDVSEMLTDLAESLRGEVASRGLYLRLQGPPSLTVDGDRVKVQRVVQNLVLNALKATAEGGVTLGWTAPKSEADPRWVLTVQDTGPGFQGTHGSALTRALEEATEQGNESGAKMADEHVRSGGNLGRAPTKTVEPGEGIGLSIVKRLCELLGAAIELESSPGQGTIFRLRFPVQFPVGTPNKS
jgi:signal transduction histidine kinase